MKQSSWSVRGSVALLATAAVLACGAPAALADGPIVGVDLFGAIPLKGTRKTADFGGGAGAYGGYQFDLHPSVRLALLANPEFSFFPSDNPVNTNSGRQSDSDVISVMGLLGGPRLTFGGGDKHLFLDGRGGYYRELSGPLNSAGAGYNVGGGFSFEFARGTSLTISGRYNESFMRAQRGKHENFRFVTAGMGIEHRFNAPEPIVEAQPPPPPPPPPPALPMKKKLILRGVNFDFAKANIRSDARPVLDEAIATLKEAGDVVVSVEGHTDSVGTNASNETLSVRRARAVAEYMQRGGIAADRMRISGYGETRPIAGNDTADGRAQNRRVELRVVQ